MGGGGGNKKDLKAKVPDNLEQSHEIVIHVFLVHLPFSLRRGGEKAGVGANRLVIMFQGLAL